MYLPKSLEITDPYVSRWYGESGRQYEFGVIRSASLRVEEPFVYILAKHEGNMIVPLSVGQTDGGRAGPNGSMPHEWEQALAEGMTHAHLRFEARSEAFRQAEVRDLAVALGRCWARCPWVTKPPFGWDLIGRSKKLCLRKRSRKDGRKRSAYASLRNEASLQWSVVGAQQGGSGGLGRGRRHRHWLGCLDAYGDPS